MDEKPEILTEITLPLTVVQSKALSIWRGTVEKKLKAAYKRANDGKESPPLTEIQILTEMTSQIIYGAVSGKKLITDITVAKRKAKNLPFTQLMSGLKITAAPRGPYRKRVNKTK